MAQRKLNAEIYVVTIVAGYLLLRPLYEHSATYMFLLPSTIGVLAGKGLPQFEKIELTATPHLQHLHTSKTRHLYLISVFYFMDKMMT